MTKHTILFLAANPSGLDPRMLVREARSIRAELKRTGYRDRFEFETGWVAEPLDLLRELRELKPTVVHFSGRGGQGGLFLQAADGTTQLVSVEALAEAFSAAGTSVKLVVLSACYSQASAEALLAHVDCVVGMSGSIHDDAARSFAIGFYGALGEHESVAAAYRHGSAAINLEGLAALEHPQLVCRNGFDADHLILAAVRRPVCAVLPCPYPGMRPCSADNADHFHGRDAEVNKLLARLRAGEREICIIGPSGSGKSSLLAAGVLPRLARGMAELGPFLVRWMRPGEHPAARLSELLEVSERELSTPAEAVTALLARRALGSSVLIVVDQLEELFTLASAVERDRFLVTLRALRAEPRCVVIFTLRADFFGAFMESPLWTDHRGRISRIEVGPLRGEALRDAIAQPAHDLGVLVEPELIERLLADAASEPGVLPILQETLVQLWDRRQDRTLTLADYQALGDRDRSGLAVALSRHADATLDELTPTQQGIARRILFRLVSFGEGRPDTRRQQPLSKLRSAGDDAADFEHALRRMIANRLLTMDDDDDGGEARVDLAHEVMIAACPTLASWIQARRRDEQYRRLLEVAAAQWVEHRRGARGLLDPIELAEAEAWQQTESAHELGQSADVVALIAASKLAHEASRKQSEADRRRAEVSERENQHLIALSYQETARQLVLDGRLQAAMPYLMAARLKGEEGEPLRMLFWTATRRTDLILPLDHQGAVNSAAFSPDGTRVVTASVDKTARLWDAATGRPLTAPLEHQGAVNSAAFSPDGSRVVTASDDRTARVWDAATGAPRALPLEHQDGVLSVAFSPDGTRVVTASDDRTARVWDATTGRPLTAPLEHRGEVHSAVFSRDGTRVVTASADRTARVWDAATGSPLAAPLEHRGCVIGAVFSPDGTRVVTASRDHTARVWDAATGEPLSQPLEHKAGLNGAAFSPDGTRVVTASLDHTARVWDVATGVPLSPPLEHLDDVWSAVFSPDGTRVVTASYDHTARVWDAVTGKPLASPLEHQRWVWSAVFSPDGTRVVTASLDHTARLWDAATSKPLATPLEHQAAVMSAVFSPDGARVVTASGDHMARVWDAVTGRALATPLEHQGYVMSAAFSSDGTRVVTASGDHTARVWDAATGSALSPPLEHRDRVWSATFSSDGTRVVTASDDKTARLWDAATGKPLATPLEHQGGVLRASFSPDGTRVVTASFDNTARVWDAVTGRALATPLEHQGTVNSAVFSPDGTRVVTASDDYTARIWDAATGKPLAIPLEHQDRVWSAAFSPDGTRVVTTSNDHTARVWDAATGKPFASPLEHQQTVNCAAFSPDGTRVVTASDDHTARLWDAATGKSLAIPLEHHGPVRNAAFSPDGTRVVTASDDHTARVWEFPLHQGTLAEWSALAERSPFVLSGGVHVRRTPLRRGAGIR